MTRFFIKASMRLAVSRRTNIFFRRHRAVVIHDRGEFGSITRIATAAFLP
jgi:hypothetical protein